MMSMPFDVTIDGFDCFFAALADDWLSHCLLMYDKESLHKTVGRCLWGVQYEASRGPTLPVGRSLLSANALSFRYLTGRPFDALI